MTSDSLCQVYETRNQRRLRVTLVSLLVMAVVGLGEHGVRLGIGHDLDSRAIFETSIPAILRGSYAIGRSYGNPLYEFIAAWLYAAGGIIIINVYSLVLAVGSIFIFDQLLKGTNGLHHIFALIGFSLSPVFLINSSTFGEWMQTYFSFLCLIWAADRWVDFPSARRLSLYALFSALLVLTRPDASFVCICVCFAMMWQRHFEIGKSSRLLAASVMAGTATFAIFVSINGGFGFLKNIVFDYSSWSMSIIVGIVGILILFGFIGTAVLSGYTAWLLIRLCRGAGSELTFWSRVFIVAAIVGVFRFVVLPSKVEYIFHLLILALLMLAHERARLVWTVLFSSSAILSSLFTISLFERRGTDDHLSIRPHLGPSAVLQDWIQAEANADVMNPDFLRRLAHQVYAQEAGPLPTLYTINWGPGILSDSGDLLIGETEAYRLDNPRQPPSYQRKLYRTIFVCNRSMFHGNPGWRHMEQPVPALRRGSNPGSGEINVQCHRDAFAGLSNGS
jgi:hypothetical protein